MSVLLPDGLLLVASDVSYMARKGHAVQNSGHGEYDFSMNILSYWASSPPRKSASICHLFT